MIRGAKSICLHTPSAPAVLVPLTQVDIAFSHRANKKLPCPRVGQGSGIEIY